MKKFFEKVWREHRVLQCGLALYFLLTLTLTWHPPFIMIMLLAFFCSALSGAIMDIVRKMKNKNDR